MTACTISGLPYCSICTNIEAAKLANAKETNMTVTTVTIPTAAREYVTVKKTIEAQEQVFTLKMTGLQAGYLRDVLVAHITGEVATFLRPLATALGVAGAAREYAANTNKREAYSDGYPAAKATVDFADNYERELAGVPAKIKTPNLKF